LLAFLLLSITPAFAAEISRAEYVESVEPLCKKDVEDTAGIFKGVGAEIKEERLKKASHRFSRAAGIFRTRLRALQAVPQPTADEQRLGEWFDALRTEVKLLAEVGGSLRAEQKGRAEHLVKQLHQNANRANNLVLGFGFAYCTLDPGRFA
jgi:hypothetical protein